MKKIALMLVLAVFATGSLFAAGPDYFAFTLGSGGAYNVDNGDIISGNNMGFTYSFNDSFAGGFSFFDIAGNNIDMVSISVMPLENMSLTMHSGQIDDPANPPAVFGFGAGFGYDFFTNSETFFSALGIYFDWFAGNGAPYDIENGGVLSIGLRTKLGL